LKEATDANTFTAWHISNTT